MAVPVIAALAVLSGAAAVLCSGRKPSRAAYVFRPLTLILAGAVALAGGAAAGFPVTKAFILGGLACSLAGDVFMMLPRKRFTIGLACFLAANLCYIMAFRPAPGRSVPTVIILPFLVLGLFMFHMLGPTLGKLRFPVLVYIAAISSMACLAGDRFIYAGGPQPLFAFAGALLFVASDCVLAYNRFIKPFDAAQFIILGTFFPAQILIALSV